MKANIQGGSNMNETDLCVNKCKQSRSYLNHLVHNWSYLAHLFLEWEMFRTKDVEKNQNIYFMFNNFFSTIVPVMRLSENLLYSRAGYRWQYSAYALHVGIPRICNRHSFSTAIVLAPNNLSFELYIHFLSCYLIISFLAFTAHDIL